MEIYFSLLLFLRFAIQDFQCFDFFISLSNDKILDVTKLKAFADDKLNVA